MNNAIIIFFDTVFLHLSQEVVWGEGADVQENKEIDFFCFVLFFFRGS